jgi:hypothetical protein
MQFQKGSFVSLSMIFLIVILSAAKNLSAGAVATNSFYIPEETTDTIIPLISTENLIVFAIVAVAVVWLIWKFTRKKKGCASCDKCE